MSANGHEQTQAKSKKVGKGQPYTALETSDSGLLLDAAGRSRRRRDQGVFSDLADQSRLQEILTGMCHKSHVGTMVFPVVLDQVADELRQPGVDRRVGGRPHVRPWQERF